ncbi:MAG: hypothetical protein AAF092_06710 [Pseudomonadota bacterium]
MLKKCAVTLLCGLLAFGAVPPTPAQANTSEDLAKLLFGALLIYGIKEAVESDARPRTVTTPPRATPHRPRERAAVRPKMPVGCIVQHQLTSGERRTVFGKRCVTRHYTATAAIPARCERRFETVRGPRRGYGLRCLQRAGFEW